MARVLIGSRFGNRDVSSRHRRLVSMAFVVACAAMALAATGNRAMAQALTWNTNTTGTPVDGTGPWNTTSTHWYNGSTDVDWPSGGTAQFGAAAGTTAFTVTVSGSPTIGGLTFQSQAYSLSGGSLSLSGAVPVTVNASSGGTISSRLIGSGGLTMNGPGTLDAHQFERLHGRDDRCQRR